jgi:hypothetical protein
MDTLGKEEIQVNDEIYDYGSDFKILSEDERREIMKSAKNLLKVQHENAVMLADALPLKNEGQEKI